MLKKYKNMIGGFSVNIYYLNGLRHACYAHTLYCLNKFPPVDIDFYHRV